VVDILKPQLGANLNRTGSFGEPIIFFFFLTFLHFIFAIWIYYLLDKVCRISKTEYRVVCHRIWLRLWKLLNFLAQVCSLSIMWPSIFDLASRLDKILEKSSFLILDDPWGRLVLPLMRGWM
jgi:uncharacterized membrane protein YfhO